MLGYKSLKKLQEMWENVTKILENLKRIFEKIIEDFGVSSENLVPCLTPVLSRNKVDSSNSSTWNYHTVIILGVNPQLYDFYDEINGAKGDMEVRMLPSTWLFSKLSPC